MPRGASMAKNLSLNESNSGTTIIMVRPIKKKAAPTKPKQGMSAASRAVNAGRSVKAKSNKNTMPGVVSTLSALARSAGVHLRTVSDWKTQPDFPIRPDGSFSIWQVAQWHALRAPSGESDPEMIGPDSPALERFREERWRITKLERQTMEGTLLRRDVVRDVLGLVASQLRRLGERLQQSAVDPISMLEDTIADIDRIGRERIQECFPGEDSSE